jgi:hypothetical protein
VDYISPPCDWRALFYFGVSFYDEANTLETYLNGGSEGIWNGCCDTSLPIDTRVSVLYWNFNGTKLIQCILDVIRTFYDAR